MDEDGGLVVSLLEANMNSPSSFIGISLCHGKLTLPSCDKKEDIILLIAVIHK